MPDKTSATTTIPAIGLTKYANRRPDPLLSPNSAITEQCSSKKPESAPKFTTETS